MTTEEAATTGAASKRPCPGGMTADLASMRRTPGLTLLTTSLLTTTAMTLRAMSCRACPNTSATWD